MRALAVILGAAVIGGFAACSSFTASDAPPTPDGGGAPSEDANVVPIADAGIDAFDNDSGFGDPLGRQGCTAARAAAFCDDFEADASIEKGKWQIGQTAGDAGLIAADDAPSPTHYAQFTMNDSDVGSGCANERLYQNFNNIPFTKITFEYAANFSDVNSADTSAQEANVAFLNVNNGMSGVGELFYTSLTSTQMYIHEQWDDSNNAFVAFPTAVPRNTWLFVEEVLDMGTQTLTVTIEGQPKPLTVMFSDSTFVEAKNISFGIGYSCTPRGGTLGFDDVVVTYE